MNRVEKHRGFAVLAFIKYCGLVLVAVLATAMAASAQQLPGTENGEWRYWGGDSGNTWYSPLAQINAGNFADLEVAWLWRGENFSPETAYFIRSTPIYVDGTLYTLAPGTRRQVVAIDPATGETLWSFREPETTRHLRSPRAAYGKNVAYGEVDGRGVIYFTTPGFFLWALDARTGRPLEGWGSPIDPFEEFSRTGVVDLVEDLLVGWGPWEDYVAAGGTYDPDYGVPRELGMITSSAGPIVVNDVVVVLTAHEASYRQTRIENIPGDVMGYDARTGEKLWKFHIIPRPGEYGHETWENDAWYFSGDGSQWSGAAADPELGLVYFGTNASTVETYTGHRPGDNLFTGSVVALDVQTGERRWHFQIHRSEQWNYDIPVPPILMDLTVDGEVIPALVQNTKVGLIFAFNRETGEPIWPIEERPVIQSEVPGHYTSPTQPYPTWPEPLDPIVLTGLTEEYVIDYTPDLKERALEILSDFRIAGLYVPRLPYDHDHDFLNYVGCGTGGSGLNASHRPSADPTTGRMYLSHNRACSAPGFMAPTDGVDMDVPEFAQPSPAPPHAVPNETPTTGLTVAAWAPAPGVPLPRIDGLPLWKPQDKILSGYDMNTGDRMWDLPVGETPGQIRNHPLLEGVDIPNSGSAVGYGVISMVMGDLLVETRAMARGGVIDPVDEAPQLNARDKRTGEILASVELPASGQYGMMTYLHEGEQYVVVQIGHHLMDMPGSLVALKLP